MASCAWKKLKGKASVKSILRHCDKDWRVKTQNHSNKDINKSLSHLNEQCCSYAEACDKYDSKLDAHDKVCSYRNKRKDRVTAIAHEIPAPAGLSTEKQHEWFMDALACVQDLMGEENIIAWYVHVDEIHEYINAMTFEEQESRPHLHIIEMPMVDGTLCAKQVCSRNNMIALNDAIHQMSLDKYGIPFMTGEKRKGGTTKQLKQASKEIADSMTKEQINAEKETVRKGKFESITRKLSGSASKRVPVQSEEQQTRRRVAQAKAYLSLPTETDHSAEQAQTPGTHGA